MSDILRVDDLALLFAGLAGLLLAVGAFTSSRGGDGGSEAALWAIVAGSVAGVFLARQLIVVLACWQTMVLAVAMIVARQEPRGDRAAFRYATTTLAGTLAAVVPVVALGAARGTFDLNALAARPVAASGQVPLALLLAAPFITALPLFPVHGWAIRAHVAAAVPGALLLSGVVGTAALYALLRICLPLFPHGMSALAPALVALAAVGVLYAAIVAARQGDMRRFLAYASLCHLDLAALALFAGSPLGVRAAVIVTVSHALVVPALLLLARPRGHRPTWPWYAAVGALIGVPATSGFAAQSLALVALWERFPLATLVAAAGLVILGWAAVRLLAASDTAAVGPARGPWREHVLVAPLLAAAVVIGVAPYLITDRVTDDIPVAERAE
ncbi:MAG TPA: proton-conducting transporter membrane subunit [Candidatus Limnocylindria bacterium]|nr:proton-conducting transporter membrane subunit [Candidatus Limnocylindria bacterium]